MRSKYNKTQKQTFGKRQYHKSRTKQKQENKKGKK